MLVVISGALILLPFIYVMSLFAGLISRLHRDHHDAWETLGRPGYLSGWSPESTSMLAPFNVGQRTVTDLLFWGVLFGNGQLDLDAEMTRAARLFRRCFFMAVVNVPLMTYVALTVAFRL
jgi:hypothetical protein